MSRLGRFRRAWYLIILLLPFVIPASVNAALLCRSDPVVVLSNGMTLDISAYISTMPWQVKEAHYELHVPVGVSLIVALHTPTWLTSQETFTLVADQPRGQYVVITTVYTSVGGASVDAETVLVSPLGLRLGRYTKSGWERTPLSVQFRG